MIENDYELILLAQEGDESTINYIYQKYKPIIIKKSKIAIQKIAYQGIEIDDIMQEAYIGLQEAIESFKENDETTFYTFANLCIDRKIANFIKKNSTGKGKILNEAIQISTNIEEIVKDNNSIHLENNITEKDVIKKISKKLTTFENEVFELKMKEYSIKEISEKLKVDIKSVYNAINRIKVKIQKIVKIDN